MNTCALVDYVMGGFVLLLGIGLALVLVAFARYLWRETP